MSTPPRSLAPAAALALLVACGAPDADPEVHENPTEAASSAAPTDPGPVVLEAPPEASAPEEDGAADPLPTDPTPPGPGDVAEARAAAADAREEAAAEDGPRLEKATLGAGCFWCVEAVYEQLDGIESAVSGYMGGHVVNPTYEQVCSKKTGHVEVVQLEFDPEVISYEAILAWFWRLHDPTTRDRQGNDVGPQYRSVIFTHSAAQAEAARDSLAKAQPDFDRPIVTDIRDAETFYVAEEVHQGYYFDNQRAGYCRYVIAPKLEKLGLEK